MDFDASLLTYPTEDNEIEFDEMPEDSELWEEVADALSASEKKIKKDKQG